jgi:glutathione-regulated potassium-efflux system ancillary protein KefG
MSKVLLVVGHPDLSQSIRHPADGQAVRHRLRPLRPGTQHRRQDTTPLFKQWQDKVFTLGWAFTMDGSASQRGLTIPE